MPGFPPVLRFPSHEDMSRHAADLAAERLRQAAGECGRAGLALSGGDTPRRALELLAGADLPWPAVHVFWADERCVPPDDRLSNFRLVREAFLDRVPIPDANIRRMRGEAGPAEAAREYEEAVRAYLGTDAGLDLVLLGLGRDGHTASLFPGSPVLRETVRLVAAVDMPGQPPLVPRLTLTLPCLDASRAAIFLVSGPDKGPALERVLAGEQLPAGLVRPREELLWLVAT